MVEMRTPEKVVILIISSSAVLRISEYISITAALLLAMSCYYFPKEAVSHSMYST